MIRNINFRIQDADGHQFLVETKSCYALNDYQRYVYDVQPEQYLVTVAGQGGANVFVLAKNEVDWSCETPEFDEGLVKIIGGIIDVTNSIRNK